MNPRNVQPLGDRVLVEIIEGDVKSKSGLDLSNANNMELPVMGKVIRVGDKSSFKEGDVLLFRRYGVDELKFNLEGEEVKIFLVEGDDCIGRIIPDLIESLEKNKLSMTPDEQVGAVTGSAPKVDPNPPVEATPETVTEPATV